MDLIRYDPTTLTIWLGIIGITSIILFGIACETLLRLFNKWNERVPNYENL
jgi:hypothetical protein